MRAAPGVALCACLILVLITTTAAAAGRRDLPRVASAGFHTLVVKADGTLWAFGDFDYGALGLGPDVLSTGYPRQVGSAANWISVVTSETHSAGLRADGALWTWGDNWFGALGDGTPAGSGRSAPTLVGQAHDWVAIAVGNGFTLALKANGTLWSAGANDAGQLGDGSQVARTTLQQVGTDTDWATVAAGNKHGLAIRANGTLWAWGANGSGQLGTGYPEEWRIPVEVSASHMWTRVYACGDRSYGLQVDGDLWGWGEDNDGMLGDGGTYDRHVPVPIGPGTRWRSLTPGPSNTFAIAVTGTLWGWGSNSVQAVGPQAVDFYSTPQLIGKEPKWTAVAVGFGFVVAAAVDGTLKTWGLNAPLGETDHQGGYLGDGGLANRPWSSPATPLTDQTTWLAAQAGRAHTQALRSDGQNWGWGRNDRYQVAGKYLDTQLLSPRQALSHEGMSIALGDDFNIDLTSGGAALTWGAGTEGQGGTGGVNDQPGPVPVSGLWRAVTAGSRHAVAVAADGTLWGWGSSASGELGDQASSPVVTPQYINNLPLWVSAAAGNRFTLALASAGFLYAWGLNDQGQLGTGSFDPAVDFGAITGGPWRAVAAGGAHALAIREDGTLFAWGSNSHGQLGTVTGNLATPTAVNGDHDWVAMAAGDRHSLAIKADGSLWAWGDNSSGQLGDGTTISASTPVRIGSFPGNEWLSVDGGFAHSVGLTAASTRVWCWGAGESGQLGGFTTESSAVPRSTSPVRAEAGPDQHVSAGDTVTLDGGASLVAASYAWTIVGSGPPLYNADTARPSFTAQPHVGTVRVRLVVTDTFGNTDEDIVNVTVFINLGEAVFVSARTGSDTNPGTLGQPVNSLSQGLALARRSFGNNWDVYVDDSDQAATAPLSLANHMSLYGGFTLNTDGGLAVWTRTGSNHTRLLGAATALVAADVREDTSIDGFDIYAANGREGLGGPGENSIGIRVLRSNERLTITNCRIQAGMGGTGATGTPGTAGQPGGAGAPGQDGFMFLTPEKSILDLDVGTVDLTPYLVPEFKGISDGGAGGNDAGRSGGKGGDSPGTYLIVPNGVYSPGSPGYVYDNSDTAARLLCVAQGVPCFNTDGARGEPGTTPTRNGGVFYISLDPRDILQPNQYVDAAAGADGWAGSGGLGGPAASVGHVIESGEWFGLAGYAGGAGTRGSGGSGGGGGHPDVFTAGWAIIPLSGGGGGGGGAAGHAGAGGQGGQPGGGSFGIFLSQSSPVINWTTIGTSGGGTGGVGGEGGAGGSGGDPGAGGHRLDVDVYFFSASSGKGGTGGRGGTGGSGGGGAGGNGGDSCGIQWEDRSAVNVYQVCFESPCPSDRRTPNPNASPLVGLPGPGGAGGAGGNAGSAGQAGSAGNFCPPYTEAAPLPAVPPSGVIDPPDVVIPPGTVETGFSNGWSGSDIAMSLVSPAGRTIDRTTQAPDVRHFLAPTFESFWITTPEPGPWKVRLFGADVQPQGEFSEFRVFSVPANRPPVARCSDVTVVAGPLGTAPASIDGGSVDPDGDLLTFGQIPAGAYAVGSRDVTLSVFDSHGAAASCTGTVTVEDRTPPTIACPASLRIRMGGAVSLAATAVDNAAAQPTVSGDAPSQFPVGATTVTFTATDAAGNAASCRTVVEVMEDTVPTVTCPADLRRVPPVSRSDIGHAIPSDPLDSSLTVASSAPAVFAPGLTVVTWSATDHSGNTGTCTQRVRVNRPPTVEAGPAMVAEATGPSATKVQLHASGTDPDGDALTYTWAGPFSEGGGVVSGTNPVVSLPLGTSILSLVASDGLEQSEANTVTVTVRDTTPPAITISVPTGAAVLLNEVVVAAFSCEDGATGVVSCTATAAAGTRIDTATIGEKTFTVSAVDGGGNEGARSVTYTVTYRVRALYDEGRARTSGSTVPIKIRIEDAAGTDHSRAETAVVATGLSLHSTDAPGPVEDSGNANPDGDFRFTTDGYLFNLSSKGLGTGTYLLHFRCGTDPSDHTVQFQIK